MKLLLLGATGLVGNETLKLALSSDIVSEVIAPTRKPLAPQDRLVNPVGSDLKALIPSLTICRPSLIGGERNERRAAEGTALTLLRFLAPILPKKFRVNPADAIAAALLDAVVAGKTGCRWIDSRALN